MTQYLPALNPAYFLNTLYDEQIDLKIRAILQSRPRRPGAAEVIAVGQTLHSTSRRARPGLLQEASLMIFEKDGNGRITYADFNDGMDEPDRAHFSGVLPLFLDQTLRFDSFPRDIQEEWRRYPEQPYMLLHFAHFAVLLPDHFEPDAMPHLQKEVSADAPRPTRLKACALFIRQGKTNHERLAIRKGVEGAWPDLMSLFEDHAEHSEIQFPAQLADYNPALLDADTRS